MQDPIKLNLSEPQTLDVRAANKTDDITLPVLPDRGDTKPNPFVKTMKELRELFPETYNATVKALGWEISQKMKKDAEKLKRAMRGA